MNIRGVIILFLIIGIANTRFCFSQKSDSLDNMFLIVMDIQEYYTSGKLSKSSTHKIIDAANEIIENTDSSRVIYIKKNHKLLNLSLSFPLVYTSHDTLAMQLDNRLRLVNKNIITRDKPSAFSSNELICFLQHNNAKEIIVIGLLAEEFICKSTIAGKELGYDMYIFPEAIHGK